MSVSEWAGSVSDWRHALDGLKQFIGPAFKRSEQRGSASAFIDGLLSGTERKTGWMLAEAAGWARPYRIQSLLGRSSWSADALCERVRRYALDALGDPDGVLIVDETGFLKKGTHSVGVARQYSGTAGRIENCQVGVFASYASRWGHALIDRRLYLPKGWAGDPDRRAKAHVPDEIDFATKPALACEMVARLLDEGTRLAPSCWPMRSTGRTIGSGACWRRVGSPMFWLCARPTACGFSRNGTLFRPTPRR